MKKIILIPLSLLLIACSQTSTITPDNIQEKSDPIEETPEEKERTSNINSDTERLDSLDQSQIKLSDCDAFNGSNEKIACQDQYYFDQAQRKNDSSICSEIQEPQNQTLCKEELS